MRAAPALDLVDGREVRVPIGAAFDVVVVGSGPAGAAAARVIARQGLSVAVVEEGRRFVPAEFPPDGFSAMSEVYRGLGSTLCLGRAPMPYLQGCAVGGTSVVNGAISWRLPRDVYDEWVAADPEIGAAIPWSEIEAELDVVERDLGIHPTPEAISGANNLLLARGAEALGIAHRPIHRNVKGCRGLGRCLQGCPEGNKQSMDFSYLPEACAAGARIFASAEARAVTVERGRAVSVEGRSAAGARVRLRARHAVVLAASAVQTPILLARSGLGGAATGLGFQCHPGVSMAGRFREEVRLWTGATQGHEVTGLRREGIKIEALGYDATIVATRHKETGAALGSALADLAHWANWGAAIRARARGRVRRGIGGPWISYGLGPADMKIVRRSVRILGELMLAAGAEYVTPGVYGWHEKVTDPSMMGRFEEQGPLDPRAYSLVATHLFGSCRMGSDPRTSVVRPDFRHHRVEGLYVADSSVFPSNTGVNPQTTILALAAICGRRVTKR